jgi:hypothetical protein
MICLNESFLTKKLTGGMDYSHAGFQQLVDEIRRFSNSLIDPDASELCLCATLSRVQWRSAIPQISQAHAQMMMQRVGDADGEAEAEESLGQAEGVEVVVAAEELARDCSPE